MDKIKEQQDGIAQINNDVGKKIEELKRNVAWARDLANRLRIHRFVLYKILIFENNCSFWLFSFYLSF